MVAAHYQVAERLSKYAEVRQCLNLPVVARVVEGHQIAIWDLVARRRCAAVGHCCVFHRKQWHSMVFGQQIAEVNVTDLPAVHGNPNHDTTSVASQSKPIFLR
jgi:hypothetical protein